MVVTSPSPAENRQGSFFPQLTLGELGIAFFCFQTLASLYFLQILLNPYTFASADLSMFFIPFRQTWVEQARQGIFPLWDPYTSSGTPLFASLQTAVLYPFSVFFLFLPFFWVFNLTILTHFGLAGFFMYWLMRGWGCSRSGAVVGGLGLMCGGYLFSLKHYLSTLLPVTWVPLLLLVYFGGLLRDDRRLAMASGVIGCFMFFSGGVETCYQAFAVLAMFTLIPQTLFPETPLPSLARRTAYLALFLAVFAGLSAVQFLPTWELVQHSQRDASMDIRTTSQWAMKLRDVLQFFLLDPHGYIAFPRSSFQDQVWLRAMYIGLIPFLLAVLYFRRGGVRAWTLLLVMSLSLALALGREAGLYDWFFHTLPMFDRFRYPVKFILPLVLVVAAASAWGWDVFLREAGSATDAWKKWLLILATVMMMGFGLVDTWKQPLMEWMAGVGWGRPEYNLPSLNLANLQRLLGFTGMFAFFLFLSVRFLSARRLWLGGALFIFFLDIFFSVHGFYFVVAVKEANAWSPAGEFLHNQPGLHRVFVTPQSEKSNTGDDIRRVVRGNKIRGESIPVEFRNRSGIYQMGGWDVLRLRGVLDLINLANMPPLQDRLPLLRMANVRYIAHGGPEPPDFLPLAFEEPAQPREAYNEEMQAILPPRMRVYENPGWLGRAFIAGQCLAFSDPNALRRGLLDPRWDPERWVLLYESPAEKPCLSPGVPTAPGEGEVRILDVRPDLLRLRVESQRQQFLVLTDSYYPGWEARIDEKPAHIYPANLAYRTLILPAGTHTVEFAYHPLSFRWGLGISCLTVLACAVACGVETRRRRRAVPVMGKPA